MHQVDLFPGSIFEPCQIDQEKKGRIGHFQPPSVFYGESVFHYDEVNRDEKKDPH